MRLPSTLIALIPVVLVGCASAPPTQQELASADYGRAISQQAAQDLAQTYLRGALKDPLSAQYEWGQVQRGWVKDSPLQGGKATFGYTLNVKINARNSFGGYVGFKPYMFVFRNEMLVQVWAENDIGGGQVAMVRIK